MSVATKTRYRWQKSPGCNFCDDGGHYLGGDALCPCGKRVPIESSDEQELERRELERRTPKDRMAARKNALLGSIQRNDKEI